MINNKLLLGMVIVTIVYTGCDEKQTTPANSAKDVEKKTEIMVEEIVPKKVIKTEVIVEKIQKIASISNGETLYRKCAGCHGQNAEKKALDKSAIIQNWDESKIANALKGYKVGTYGRDMKGLMKGQVSSMSDNEIDLLSKYITTLK